MNGLLNTYDLEIRKTRMCNSWLQADNGRWVLSRANDKAMHFVVTQGRTGPVVARLSWADQMSKEQSNPARKKPFWLKF